MSAKRFLDTNILFYACDLPEPDKQAVALQLIGASSTEGTGLIPHKSWANSSMPPLSVETLAAADAERSMGIREYLPSGEL